LETLYHNEMEQFGQTIDEVVRDILAACASTTSASHGSNGSSPTEITKEDIDTVVMTLLGNNARMMTPMIKAGTGVGTAPVRRAYWGTIDADLIDDLEEVTGFKEVSQYAGHQGVEEMEWGSTGNVRWCHTTEGYVSSSTYYLPVFGKNAYGVVRLTGSTLKSIVKGFGSGGTSDPINQRGTVGWKTMFTARILNDNFMNILLVTHS